LPLPLPLPLPLHFFLGAFPEEPKRAEDFSEELLSRDLPRDLPRASVSFLCFVLPEVGLLCDRDPAVFELSVDELRLNQLKALPKFAEVQTLLAMPEIVSSMIPSVASPQLPSLF